MIYDCDTLKAREGSLKFRSFLGRWRLHRVPGTWVRELLILSRTPGIELKHLFGSRFDSWHTRGVLSAFDAVDVSYEVELNEKSISKSDIDRMTRLWNGRSAICWWCIAHEREKKHLGRPYDKRVIRRAYKTVY